MSDDIVARLRQIPTAWPLVREAADEIERLRRNTGCARNQGTTQFCAEALDAQRELARVTAERDEAREMYCREAARHSVCRRSIMDARTIARMNGWDCFDAKEGQR